jgi:hypothetical protein
MRRDTSRSASLAATSGLVLSAGGPDDRDVAGPVKLGQQAVLELAGQPYHGRRLAPHGGDDRRGPAFPHLLPPGLTRRVSPGDSGRSMQVRNRLYFLLMGLCLALFVLA